MRESVLTDWRKVILDNCNKQTQVHKLMSHLGCTQETIQCAFECPPSTTAPPTPLVSGKAPTSTTPPPTPSVSGKTPTPSVSGEAATTISTKMTANFGTCQNANACVAATGATGCAGQAAAVMARQINVLVSQIACSAASPACSRRLSDVLVSTRKLSGTAGDVDFSYTITASASDIDSLKTKMTQQATTEKASFQTAFKSALTQSGANYAGNLTVKSFTAVEVNEPETASTACAAVHVKAVLPATMALWVSLLYSPK